MPTPFARKIAAAARPILGWRTMNLVRVAAGVRTPGAVSGGTNPTSTSYRCRGRLGTRKRAVVVDGSLTRVTEQIISILGATLPDGIEPRVNDRITVGGDTYTIVTDGATNDDGLGAVWSCVVKRAG